MHNISDLAETLIVFLPSILTCPIPMFVWIVCMLRGNWKQLIPWNVLFVLMLNIIAGKILLDNSQGFLPLGFFACGLIPIMTLVTYIIALLFIKKIYGYMSDDKSRKRSFRIGMILIPITPVFMITLLTVFMPLFCSSGVIVCSEMP